MNRLVADAIRTLDIENQGEKVSMPFARFRDCMLSNDVLVDNRAIKTKWDILVSKGIIIPLGDSYTKGLLNIPAFNEEFHFNVSTEVAHTHAHTHNTIFVAEKVTE